MEERPPAVADIVHYVSYGTPGGEHPSTCRAAIITATPDPDGSVVDLCVLNPTGQFFNQGVELHKGGETLGDLECPNRAQHGSPFRYCGCGWMESHLMGGTWHRREDCS
ncbi:hypothetical protein [Acrocarpospora catenulata]|uniref:hypothetical protein n=1 Tax=Acrocarpospora catenulata TaxID=2836182 RepID=UPI001BDA1475|nr:hypothetical protein [Acrocarpospora catenulata]